jgi:hypothetical protein
MAPDTFGRDTAWMTARPAVMEEIETAISTRLAAKD